MAHRHASAGHCWLTLSEVYIATWGVGEGATFPTHNYLQEFVPTSASASYPLTLTKDMLISELGKTTRYLLCIVFSSDNLLRCSSLGSLSSRQSNKVTLSLNRSMAALNYWSACLFSVLASHMLSDFRLTLLIPFPLTLIAIWHKFDEYPHMWTSLRAFLHSCSKFTVYSRPAPYQ